MNSAIESISQTSASTAGKSSPQKPQEAMMGKEDFLTLLVAQLQNQDPLNPSDPTEFTAQLAQFSSLEQLFTLNKGMESLVAATTNSGNLGSLSTIGKDVAFHSGSVQFSGQPLEIGYKLDGPATEVNISLQLNGVEIATLSGQQLSAGNHFVTWDGLTKDGVPAPSGSYTLALQAKARSGESVAAAPLIRAEVTGVDLGGANGGTLITPAGEVAFTNILGVYERGSRTSSTSEPNQAPAAGESLPPSAPAHSPSLQDSLATLIENSSQLSSQPE